MNNIAVERLDQQEFIGFWKRIQTSMLDVLFLGIFASIVYWLGILFAISQNVLLSYTLEYVLFLIFNIYLIVTYGGTPGKLMMKIRVVNGQGKYLTFQQALLRHLFPIMSLVISIVMGVNGNHFTVMMSPAATGGYLDESFNNIFGLIFVVNCLFIILNTRKRALHDLIAGTYVVDKSAVKGNA